MAQPFIKIAKSWGPQKDKVLPAADPGISQAEEERSQFRRVVQVKVGERHRIGRGKGDPENRKLLECPHAGIDQERYAPVANQVTGGPPAGMRHGGPGAKNDAFHIDRCRRFLGWYGQNRRTAAHPLTRRSLSGTPFSPSARMIT